VQKDTNHAYFGTWEMTLTMTYEKCRSLSETKPFTLNIACESSETISLIALTETVTNLEIYFVEDKEVSVTFHYSHAYCTPHKLTYTDSDTDVPFITSAIDGTNMVFTSAPNL
jgi:hypothetical protein